MKNVDVKCESTLKEADMSLDVVSFALLLLQVRIFQSAYFVHVQHHLEAIFENADE